MRKNTSQAKLIDAMFAGVESPRAVTPPVPLDYATSRPKSTRRGLGDATELLLLIAMVILPVVVPSEGTSAHAIVGPFVLGLGCGGSYEIVRRGKRQFAAAILLCFYLLATGSQLVFGVWNLLM